MLLEYKLTLALTSVKASPFVATKLHTRAAVGANIPHMKTSRASACRRAVYGDAYFLRVTFLTPFVRLCRSQEVERPGREADHSTASSVDINNLSSYVSTPPYTFMTCTGITLPLPLISRP
jgi:hypothetical protein